jgi:hypothetical protein
MQAYIQSNTHPNGCFSSFKSTASCCADIWLHATSGLANYILIWQVVLQFGDYVCSLALYKFRLLSHLIIEATMYCSNMLLDFHVSLCAQ